MSNLADFWDNVREQTSVSVCEAITFATPELFDRGCERLIEGSIVTIELLVISCLAGFCIAVPLSLARAFGAPWLSRTAWAYTYLFRGTPLLIQLWLIYFGIGSLGKDILGPAWWLLGDAERVGLVVLTLNTSAYVAEILRGGFVNVPADQREAAMASGMSPFLTLRRVLFPQALRIAWPAYGNEIILLLKGSALVSTITVLDLMGQLRTLFSRSYALDLFLYGAVLYLILVLIVTGLLRGIERLWIRAS